MKPNSKILDAKICSAEQDDDDAGFDALVAEVRDAIKRTRRVVQAMRAAADPMDISRDIAARADELRRCGVKNSVMQAEKEIAEQLGHASGPALNRWLRRHR